MLSFESLSEQENFGQDLLVSLFCLSRALHWPLTTVKGFCALSHKHSFTRFRFERKRERESDQWNLKSYFGVFLLLFYPVLKRTRWLRLSVSLCFTFFLFFLFFLNGIETLLFIYLY